MTFLVSACDEKQSLTWRYAIEESATDVQGIYAAKFKEVIESGSDYELVIYPFGTLGESTDILEQAQAGILQFVDQSPGFTGSLIPEAQAFLLPYVLPEKKDEIDYFFSHSRAINETFHGLYAEQGLELLSMFPEGSVLITTQEPFQNPADLSGMKIRVMASPLLVETYKAFGAVPTPLPTGEIFGALQTHLIQGQENPLFYIESTKLYEVSEFITDIGHNIYTTAVMANKPFYDGLSEADKALVQKATKEALAHIIAYQEGLAAHAKEKIIKAKPDIKFVSLSGADRVAFREAAIKVQAMYVEMTGASGKAVLDQLKADLEEASGRQLEK